MLRNKRIGKSVIHFDPIESFLKKRAIAPKHRTYFQADQKMHQHILAMQMSKEMVSQIFKKTAQEAIQTKKLLTSFIGYPDGIFEHLYNFMNLKEPSKNGEFLEQEEEPSSMQLNFKLETNKFDRTVQTQFDTDSIGSASKADLRVYKKAYDKERERNVNRTLHVVTKKYREFFQEPQTAEITLIRDTLQTLKKKKNDKLKKDPSKSIDTLPSLMKAKLMNQYKDYAFDTLGNLIALRKSGNYKTQNYDILETTANSSGLCHVKKFVDHSHQSINTGPLRRSNGSFRNDDNQIDSNEFKENLFKSIHLKVGVTIKTNENRFSHLKLPRI